MTDNFEEVLFVQLRDLLLILDEWTKTRAVWTNLQEAANRVNSAATTVRFPLFYFRMPAQVEAIFLGPACA